MTPSLVTIPLAVVISLILGKLVWPRTKSAAGRTRIAYALFVGAVVSLVAAAFAYFDAERADSWVLAPETKSAAALRGAPEDKVVAVVGRVSGQNPIRSRNWAAFAECDGTCEESFPDELLVDVEDGVVTIDDASYAFIDWPETAWNGHRTTYLEQAWPVLVVGEAKGDHQATIADASIVYAGPITNFRAYAQTQHRLAFALLILDLVIASALAIGGIVALVRRNAATPATTPAPSSPTPSA